MNRLIATVIETVRLAIAVLAYMWLEPQLVDIVGGYPIVGWALSALIAAGGTLVAVWLVLPFSRVVVDVERYSNNVPYSGSSIDLECEPNTLPAAKYWLNVRHEGYGLVARGITLALAKRGMEVSFEAKTRHLRLSSDDINADEEQLDDGLVIALDDSASSTSWNHVLITVGSLDVPSNHRVEVRTRLRYPKRRPWYFFFTMPHSNIKHIVLTKKNP